MSRPLRIEYSDAYYHVMNRGRGRQSIFHDEVYFTSFLHTLAEAHDRFGLEVHAYCLMTNHFHLLLKTPEGNLQRVMRHVGGLYTQRYNRLRNTDGPLFRGRYKAILVDSDEYLLHLSRYIHRNPLEAKMVDELERYEWSSYLAYIGKVPGQPWLYKNEVYGQLKTKRLLRKKYKEFVMGSEACEDIEEFYGRERFKPILGDEDFVQRIVEEYGDSSIEVRVDDRRLCRPSMERILQVVSEAYGVTPSVLLKIEKGRGKKNMARKVAMYLAQNKGGLRLTEIANIFGLKHYGGVSNAIYGVVKELELDGGFEKSVNSIINRFDP
jgi:putative transposase